MSSNFLNQKLLTCQRRQRLMLALGGSVLFHSVLLIAIAALLPVAPSPALPEGMQIDVQEPRLAALSQKKELAAPIHQHTTPPVPSEKAVADHPETAATPAAEIAPSPVAETPNIPVAPQAAASVETDNNLVSPAGSSISKVAALSAAAPYQSAQFNAAYLRNPPPRYPAMSRQLQEEGRVEVLVDVSAEGLPGKVSLKTSSGFPRLDKAALEVVQTWRFVPAKRGDQAEASTVTVPLVFNLQN